MLYEGTGEVEKQVHGTHTTGLVYSIQRLADYWIARLLW